MNPGILAFVLGAWSGCIQAGWGSDLCLPAVVLWNSASHVSTMLGSNLDLSDILSDIRPWYSTLIYTCLLVWHFLPRTCSCACHLSLKQEASQGLRTSSTLGYNLVSYRELTVKEEKNPKNLAYFTLLQWQGWYSLGFHPSIPDCFDTGYIQTLHTLYYILEIFLKLNTLFGKLWIMTSKY